MANPFALPALGHVLRQLLMDAAPNSDLSFLGMGGWQVSMLPPDLIKRGDTDGPLLNLYLYQVAQNPGWRNRDARTHDAAGQRIAAPPLALDLHYLITAYGSQPYQAEALLGHALLALHDRPVLTRDYIAAALKLPGSPTAIDKHLAASGLAEQVESVRLSLDNLSGDDLARLWSGYQLGMRPSVSLLATVLLLSSRTTPQTPLPVTARTITTVPLHRPVIASVHAKGGALLPVEPGTTILISGDSLFDPTMTLLVSDVDVTTLIDPAGEGHPATLTVPLPATLPAKMVAGIQTVEIRHGVLIEGDPVPRNLIGSNVDSFVLHPRVAAAAQDGGTVRAVLVDFAHEIGERQSVRITLEEVVAGNLTGVRFAAVVPEGNPDVPPPTNAPRPARVKLNRVWAHTSAAPGDYRVLASVDGVASIPHSVATDVKVTLT
ncbi:DUF4255 domain-containing protein [Sphingomonas sp. LB-2]|uniref:DUF4255 domain-containing protein n=1 Tax=Sphingomonas caeni TaxID=2984949 RepID=UPI0022329604|nr:DUF4255 domain-containing protein [Sphingomonas caeni]MCW3846503.1 DUF4255 domain-containing protein [Sphingomonas caeni]